ncbi:hypothetical protein KI387_032756 [Taxus chinensis]|uniref:Dirigent protein n=1 Tax=Taxus chinensis TaxID=29808 RepID=A0AA38F0B3_TAXCH|nr:hypothetical protein KI387_032756 [Taxus chinensis]
MERRCNELLLLLILVTMWGSYATASRKLLLTESKEEGDGEAENSTPPNPTTITFFMHHIIEGKPGLGVGFPTGLQAGSGIGNIPGLLSPFGNNFNGNGNGPLPLTIPSGAINNSPLFGFPSTTGLGGVQGLGLGVGSGALTPGLGLNVPGIINGQFNPQPGLQGASGVPHDDNVIVTVIEDTLTEGPDLHSSELLGKGEGYYYHIDMPATAGPDFEDHNSLLIAFTAKFEGSEYAGSSIEFAGKDNAGLPEREIAVVGGTGVFHEAQGHALIETVSHTEAETVLKFTVSLIF